MMVLINYGWIRNHRYRSIGQAKVRVRAATAAFYVLAWVNIVGDTYVVIVTKLGSCFRIFQRQRRGTVFMYAWQNSSL